MLMSKSFRLHLRSVRHKKCINNNKSINKKSKIMKSKIGIRNIFACFILSLICAGCNAKGVKGTKSMYAVIDSTMRAEIGDSISAIICNSKKVVVERIKENNGNVELLSSKKLSGQDCRLLTFLIVSNDGYGHLSKVFGLFRPNVRFIFYMKKCNVQVEIDFGLKQICFKKANGDIIKMLDLKGNELLKFCNVLFPDDDYLSFLLKKQQ